MLQKKGLRHSLICPAWGNEEVKDLKVKHPEEVLALHILVVVFGYPDDPWLCQESNNTHKWQ